MIDVAFVKKWSAKYPVCYDEKNYDPYIKAARAGDANALRKLTEWKNVGQGSAPTPIPFCRHRYKEQAFQVFLQGLPRYIEQDGQRHLQNDFLKRAPVWSIFWCHVLFGTPIFDTYTNIAYHKDIKNKILSKKDAAPQPPNHWQIFDEYKDWFKQKVEALQEADPNITERDLDRALVRWGKELTKKSREKCSTSTTCQRKDKPPL